jgi:hypothetical protein
MTKMILAIEHWEKNQDLDLSSTHRIINYIREDGSKEDDRISDKITNFTKQDQIKLEGANTYSCKRIPCTNSTKTWHELAA